MKKDGAPAKLKFIEAYALLLYQPKKFIIDDWYAQYREKERAIAFIQTKGLYAEFRRFVK